MVRARNTITRHEIIQVASEFFFEKGYSATSPKAIAAELQISTGNITYYFPTKEHLLAVIVEMLCDFQWKLFEMEADRGIETISSICLEFMTVASACQENSIAKDFFTAVFQSDMCRDYLRYNHIQRAKRILAEQCSDWSEEQYIIAELMIMGIQYSIITVNDDVISLKDRIAGALNQILTIYNVDDKTKADEIEKVLQMDCRQLGKRVLKEFINYVETTNEQTLNKIQHKHRRKY